MKLWIDDVRPAPEGYVWCKSVEATKALIIILNRGVEGYQYMIDHPEHIALAGCTPIKENIQKEIDSEEHSCNKVLYFFILLVVLFILMFIKCLDINEQQLPILQYHHIIPQVDIDTYFKDYKGKKISSKYYTVSYASGRKKVGKYKVTIKLKGNYSGTLTAYFTIVPKESKVEKLTAAKKSLKVKLDKVSSQATGYEIESSTSKTFKSKYTKTKKVTSYKTTSVTLKSLKAKKTYYVRVRTYKTVDGKKYYSDWSSKKYKKTK